MKKHFPYFSTIREIFLLNGHTEIVEKKKSTATFSYLVGCYLKLG